MDPSTIRAESPDELIEEEIFAKPTGVSRPPPPEPVVVQEKPAKQKRPLSEKQKAHLQRITKLAAEKRRAKAAEKVAETPQLPKQSVPETPIAKESPPPAPTPRHQAPKKDDFEQWMQNFARFDTLVREREAQAEQQRAAKEAAEQEQRKATEKTEPVAPEFGEYTKYFL